MGNIAFFFLAWKVLWVFLDKIGDVGICVVSKAHDTPQSDCHHPLNDYRGQKEEGRI